METQGSGLSCSVTLLCDMSEQRYEACRANGSMENVLRSRNVLLPQLDHYTTFGDTARGRQDASNRSPFSELRMISTP